MSRTYVRLTFALAVIGAILPPCVSFAGPPKLTRLFPPGGQRGSKVQVTCSGEFDPWPVSVWAPGIEVAASAEKGKLDVVVPADLPADRIWLRLYNAEGASEARPFLIGSLREITDQEPNNSPKQSQLVGEAAVVANGVLEGADVDSYTVELAAGQTLVADLDAHRELGSPMDAILQIASPDGVVLAENHDGVGLDPRLAYKVKKAGAHLVRVFAFPSEPDTTIAFRGGADYVYRLTLTTGPYITHAAPMTVSQEDPGAVEVYGWNVPPGMRLPVAPFASPEREPIADLRSSANVSLAYAFAVNFAGGVRIRLAPHPVVPVLTRAEGETVVLSPPTSVTGRLQFSRQMDRFLLPLKTGDQIIIAVDTRGIESPIQPRMRLFDPNGTIVASAEDPAPTLSTIINYTAAVEGDHELTLQDRFRQSGDLCFYRLSARLESPDFELTTAADALVVAAGQPAELVVNVTRRGPSGTAVGPITIEAVDLPAGVTAPVVVSEPSGDTATKVTLKFTATGEAFSGPIRIVGATSVPNEIKRIARTPPTLGACFDVVWLTAIAKP